MWNERGIKEVRPRLMERIVALAAQYSEAPFDEADVIDGSDSCTETVERPCEESSMRNDRNTAGQTADTIEVAKEKCAAMHGAPFPLQAAIEGKLPAVAYSACLLPADVGSDRTNSLQSPACIVSASLGPGDRPAKRPRLKLTSVPPTLAAASGRHRGKNNRGRRGGKREIEEGREEEDILAVPGGMRH